MKRTIFFIATFFLILNISKSEIFKNSWDYNENGGYCRYFNINNYTASNQILGVGTTNYEYNVYAHSFFEFNPNTGIRTLGRIKLPKTGEMLRNYLIYNDTLFYQTSVNNGIDSIEYFFYKLLNDSTPQLLNSHKFSFYKLGTINSVDSIYHYQCINPLGISTNIEVQELSLKGEFTSKYIYLDSNNNIHKPIITFKSKNGNTVYVIQEKFKEVYQWQISIFVFDKSNKLIKKHQFFTGQDYFELNSVKCCFDGDNLYFIGNLYFQSSGVSYDKYYKYSLSESKLLIDKTENAGSISNLIQISDFKFLDNKCIAIASKSTEKTIRFYSPNFDSLYFYNTQPYTYYAIFTDNNSRTFVSGVEDKVSGDKLSLIRELNLDLSSVNELSATPYIITSPNPSANYVDISVPESVSGKACNVSVYSYTGSKIYEEFIDVTNSLRLNVSYYPVGAYTVVLTTPDLAIPVKIVVQR